MKYAIRITVKGQVISPQSLRQSAGLMPGTDVECEVAAGVVRLLKTTDGSRRKTRGHTIRLTVAHHHQP